MFLCFYFLFHVTWIQCNHAGSGEQAGEPAEEAGDPDEEPTVCSKPGNPAGEFALHIGR